MSKAIHMMMINNKDSVAAFVLFVLYLTKPITVITVAAVIEVGKYFIRKRTRINFCSTSPQLSLLKRAAINVINIEITMSIIDRI